MELLMYTLFQKQTHTTSNTNASILKL